VTAATRSHLSRPAQRFSPFRRFWRKLCRHAQALLKDFLTAAVPRFIVLIAISADSYELLQMAKALDGIRQGAMSLPPVPHGIRRRH
jgi:hypothetical protein